MQRLVEVVWHGKLTRAQPERTPLVRRCRKGADLRNGSLVSHNDERFTRLDAAKTAERIALFEF